MKILTVVSDLDKGGTQRVAQNFCEAYHLIGHDSSLLALYDGGPRKDELLQAGVKVWIGLSQNVGDQIVLWQPDIVHLHSNGIQIEDVYNIKQLCPEAKFVETNVFSTPSAYSDIIDYSFQLSEWCKYLFLTRGGKKKNCFVVPNAVKTNNFKKAESHKCSDFRKRHNIPEDAFLLGRVGQSWPGKWSEYLIDIFERFSTQISQNAYLLLVNPPQELLDYINKRNLIDKVIFINKIIGDEELSNCYSSIDVFLHIATQGESFGMVLAESLLCETPVITLNTPWADNSQSEVIGNNIGGLCANTIDEFFQLTVKLYADRKLREQMGQMGRERIISRYDYLLIAQQSINIICNEIENQHWLLTSALSGIQNHELKSKQLTELLIAVKLRNRISHRWVNYLLRRLVKYDAKIHLQR